MRSTQVVVGRAARGPHEPASLGGPGWLGHVLWVLAAAGLGLLASALLAGVLRLPRYLLVLAYLPLVGVFFCAYLRWSGLDFRQQLRLHWVWGLVAAVMASLFVVTNVLSQPASPPPTGARLLFDLLWLGVVYGALDALLLSVLPVLATWQALTALGWTRRLPGQLLAGLLALAASLLVTATYHLGYPEFRGPQVAGPLVGNACLSLAYLLAANPLAAILGHIAMHLAAVLHGVESTVQLPPHYAF